MTQNNFLIRTYGKSEFALLMFPTIDDPKVAQAKLRLDQKADSSPELVGMGLFPSTKPNPEEGGGGVDKFGGGEYEEFGGAVARG